MSHSMPRLRSERDKRSVELASAWPPRARHVPSALVRATNSKATRPHDLRLQLARLLVPAHLLCQTQHVALGLLAGFLQYADRVTMSTGVAWESSAYCIATAQQACTSTVVPLGLLHRSFCALSSSLSSFACSSLFFSCSLLSSLFGSFSLVAGGH